MINRIQNLRKDSGFEVTDKIKIQIKKVDAINKAIEHHAAYIGQQTLATDVTLVDDLEANTALEVEIDDETKTFIQISK